jgi:uncharacterized protein (UPF0303 family)
VSADDFPGPDELLAQEARLVLPSCTADDALGIGRWILATAEARDHAIVVEAWLGGRLVFRAARPGTNETNDDYVGGKRRLVERFGHASFYERQRHVAAGTTFEQATGLTFPEYAPHGGGFPLRVAGEDAPVGVVIVSGLPQQDDHALIVEALEAHLAGLAGR